jgi:inward rectifier potassium channel
MAKLNLSRFFTNKKDDEFGLDQSVTGKTRFLLSDGTFNVRKISRNRWNQFNIYHWITSISWPRYFLTISMLYLGSNIVFATIYFIIGPMSIAGITEGSLLHQWVACFFFSAQTITTVGYGGMHPVSIASSTVAALEAYTGLMIFALATGSLYSRFSKPHTKIRYSEKMIVSLHEGKNALMFMLANEFHTSLMEVEATVNLSWLDDTVVPAKRRFTNLKLEVPKITMFATNWVVVHVIDENSPLYALTQEDCIQESIQIFVLIKAFDDTFSQTIYSRKSYLSNDLIWGAKFSRPYYQDPASDRVILDLDQVGTYKKIVLPGDK